MCPGLATETKDGKKQSGLELVVAGLQFLSRAGVGEDAAADSAA
jgi:hypothetical protein